jgi:hypothetical protein
MPESNDDLRPARVEDLRACIAYALTSDGRLAKAQSAELMASIVAERLIARLERDGFVIMRRPGLGGHAGPWARIRGLIPRRGCNSRTQWQQSRRVPTPSATRKMTSL